MLYGGIDVIFYGLGANNGRLDGALAFVTVFKTHAQSNTIKT